MREKREAATAFLGRLKMFPTFFAVLARSAVVTCQPKSHNNLQIIQLFLISNFLQQAKLKDPAVTAMGASVFSAAPAVAEQSGQFCRGEAETLRRPCWC